MTTAQPETVGLLLGQGPGLGPLARRFEQPQRTLLHVLHAQAETAGDRIWLRFDSGRGITFAEVLAAANRVGAAVRDTVGEGAHVALLLRNQDEFFPAFFGAMIARGVAVPLNADSRGRLLGHVLVRSDARVLIVRVDLLDRLAELDSLGAVGLVVAVGEGEIPERVGGVAVVRYGHWLAGRPAVSEDELPDSSDVALIQFTSGTTGESKGVIYPHHFLYLYAAAIADRMGHTGDDVLFSSMPLYHAAALHLIANAALHAGCRAELRSRFSASRFWDQVAESGATHTVLLGPMAQIIYKTVREAPEHKVKLIYCPPYPPNGDEFSERFKVKLVWQGFGMTEIYTNAYYDHEPGEAPKNSLGHPFSWMEYGIVDDRDRLLGRGEVGELVFRPRLTDAMARGYYKAPEATLEAFRNFMFHTGDLASVADDGRLEFVGRKRDRIRRRGENISATELEEIASGHDAVIEAAAYAVPGEFGEDEVKLDIVASGELTMPALHAWLVERLPRYMVPRYLERCTEFPKTPSERIEKHRLAARGLERLEVHEFEPSRDPT
jgi:crotonobetaine/carnitine-CoA ligase